MQERLQKLLARANYGSRRACEDLIQQGRVAVNGQKAQIGQQADPDQDRITVDGKLAEVNIPLVYVALHKPQGVLSDKGVSSDSTPKARDLVSLRGHLFPAGRLDLPSEGLMLFTNDGDLTHLLTHPRYEHTKEYHVYVTGSPNSKALEQWQQGVFLDGQWTAPADVSILRREGDGSWLQVVLREGRKRQVRRVGAMLGHPVRRLIRVRIGPLRLGNLKPGQWRKLTNPEVKSLKAAVEESTKS